MSNVFLNKEKDYQQDLVLEFMYNYIFPCDEKYINIIVCENICKEIITKIYNIKAYPSVINLQDPMANKSFYRHAENKIYMCEALKIRPGILHEVAHKLQAFYFGYTTYNHGPEFVGCYINLLQYYSKIPLKIMIDRLKEMNINFIYPGGKEGVPPITQKDLCKISYKFRNQRKIVKLPKLNNKKAFFEPTDLGFNIKYEEKHK